MFGKKKNQEQQTAKETLKESTEGLVPEIPEEDAEEQLGKKKKKKLPGWVIIPILLGLCLVFWGISAIAKPAEKASELSVVTVEKGTVKETYNLSGTVESEKTKIFYSPVNAPVQSCKAKVGQSVKAGDLLITYDVTDLERENQKSELSALSTQYSNQDAVEQSNRAASQSAQAQAQTANTISSLKSKIQEKQAEVNSLQAQLTQAGTEAGANAEKAAKIQTDMQTNLNDQNTKTAEKENAERELANIDSLYPDKTQADKDVLKQQLVQTANTCTQEIENLKITYRSLEQQLNAIGGTDTSGQVQALATAQQELASLQSSLQDMENTSTGTTSSGITSGQAANMRISENLAELSCLTTAELVEKGKEGIKAEFDGIISDVKAIEGSAAVQGGELFTLVSSSDVSVQLEVSASDFDKVVVGNSAIIKLGESTYNGTITAVDKIALTNAKGNPVIGARVHIDNPDDNIYIGVTAKVSIVVAEKNDVLYLPNEVVNTGTEGDFVYIISDGVVKKQMVELGVAASTRVEIKSGLSEGMQVVEDSLGTVKEGMKASGVVKTEE